MEARGPRPRCRALGVATGARARCSSYRQSRCLLADALPARSEAQAVVEVNNTASETALTQELERQAEVVRDCALAATHHDRRKEQMALIDQPILIACPASSAPRRSCRVPSSSSTPAGSRRPPRPATRRSEPRSPPTAVRYISRRRSSFNRVCQDLREPTPSP
jgi:hypothetical protein